MDVELQSLTVFCDLAECGNFSETGRRVGISQPAVSLTISQLETAVGLVLLERHAGGAKLTPAGEHFLARAQEVCASYQGFKDGIALHARRLDGDVRVAFDGSWHAAMIREGMARCGDVAFADIGENWSDDLEAGRVDVVVAGRFLQDGMTAGIQEAMIKQERGITVAWHPSFYPFDPGEFSFPEVLRTTLLVPNARAAKGFGKFLEHWCGYAYGSQAAHTVFFESEKEAARAADAGLGIFLGPGDAMQRLGGLKHELDFVRTFEFLLPEAYKFGVYCRADERAKEVLGAAAAVAKFGRK